MKKHIKKNVHHNSFFQPNFFSTFEINNKNIFNNFPNIKRTIKKFISIFLNILFFVFISYDSFKKESFENDLDFIKYDIVIPLSYKDAKNIVKLENLLRKFINFTNIIIISSNYSNTLTEKNSIKVINEDELLLKENIVNIFIKLGINNTERVGWYEQQFLKMSYSKICENEYYLLWDSDTFPIKPVKMFENGFPIFDLKNEFNRPYFTTLNRLIPDLKFSKFSYISEHMIIKTEFMRKLIETIENNINIPGQFFWEKILRSIDKKNIIYSGFSEFETYGSFVDNYYKNCYKHRIWSSKRDMVKYYNNIDNLSNNDLQWLSKDYDAITFEKWDIFDIQNLIFITKYNQKIVCRPKRFFKFFSRIIKKYKFRKN